MAVMKAHVDLKQINSVESAPTLNKLTHNYYFWIRAATNDDIHY